MKKIYLIAMLIQTMLPTGLYEITVSLEGPGVLSSETFVFEDFYSIYNGEISFVSEAQFVF